MKKLDLIPFLDACDFTDEMENEMVDNDVNTHCQDDVMYINWEDNDPEIDLFPETKKWLIETYGEDVKKYNRFAINAT